MARRVHIPNDISIGSAVLAQLTPVTDRPTHRSRYNGITKAASYATHGNADGLIANEK